MSCSQGQKVDESPTESPPQRPGAQGEARGASDLLLDKLKSWTGQLGTERSCASASFFFRFAVAGERF